MLKKVTHIILSLLLLVSTTGMTLTKHLCNAELNSNHYQEKAETNRHNHQHISTEKEHSENHFHNQTAQDKTEQNCDNACCENETCHDDNCCRDEIQSIKLSLDFIKIETKEVSRTFKIDLFYTGLIVFHNFFNESGIINRYLIADSPTKIKNTQSFLQTFRC